MGSGYLPALHCGWEWLPSRKGLANGVILMAFGFGAFVFSFLSFAIINPDNLPPETYENGQTFFPPEVAIQVPKFFRIVAVVWLVLGSCAVFLIKPNPNYT